MSDKKLAVIYARYSDSNQREQSIEDQIEACYKFAEYNDYRIVHIYSDYAKTGRNDDREEFQKMLKDAKDGGFEYILMWKLDRFGRNFNETVLHMMELEKNHVELVSVTESIPDSPEGVILKGVLMSINEYYSRTISQNVKRGMMSNAKKGMSVGRAPLGYKVVDHKYVVDEEYAPIVSYLFESYKDGYSIPQIARQLKAKGLKTKSGKDFSPSGIKSLLRNRRYIGEYRYKDVVIEDGMPAIIDKQLFEIVQHRLDGQKGKSKQSDTNEYILSGKIFCGICGNAYTSETGTSHTGKKYHYYKCRTNKSQRCEGHCPSKPIPQEILEEAVVNATLNDYLDADTIDEIARVTAEETERASLVHQMEVELKEKERKVDNLVNSIEQGLTSQRIVDRLNEIEEEISELQEKIKVEKIIHPPISEEKARFYLKKLRDDLDSLNVDKSDLSAILDLLLDKVVVESNDRVTLHFSNDLVSSKGSEKYKMAHQKSKKLNQIWVNSYGDVWISVPLNR